MAIFKYQPICETKRSLILDTDIGPDCDDVGALAVLFRLQKMYNFDILGIINCTSNVYGNGTLDAVARYCDAGDIKIGQYSKPGFLDEPIHKRYNQHVSEKYSPAFMAGTLKVYDSYTLYKEALESAEDNSVVIVTIGQLNALSELVERDSELIKKKVYALIAMAGKFPEGEEYNIICDGPAGKNVLENIPCPVIYTGSELGSQFMTGYSPDTIQVDNPLFDSYKLYTNGTMQNYSWDLTAVHYAIVGEDRFYSVSEPGMIEVDERGYNKWHDDENGTQAKLMLKSTPAELAQELNSYITSFNK